jgi:hypothetical protein
VSTPAAGGDTDDESRHRQLTVLAGWRRFVDEESAPPELLPDREWRRLGDAGRLAYDEARLNHHSRLLVVATPAPAATSRSSTSPSRPPRPPR